MSATVNQVIYTTLTGNAALMAMLATDPKDGGPALYYAVKEDTPPVYPQITYRESINDPIKALGTITADYEYYDFEFWVNTRTANGVASLFEATDPLLHRQRLVVPAGQTANNFLWETLRIAGGSPAQYDRNLKVWFGMYRYQFSHCRF